MAGALDVGSAFATFTLKLDGVEKSAKQASSAMNKIQTSSEKATKAVQTSTEKINKSYAKLQDGARKVRNVSAVALAGTIFGLKQATDAAGQLESSLTGLDSVAKAFGQDADVAKEAAIGLATDGLMSVRDAAEGLKNLLATGFSLDESIDLMNGFKDAAAFNRQGTLEFGQAIVGATQGIKNQNSIMVDNAGITKNLSNILVEAGLSQQDLSKVTNDSTVRQALYNGILKEASTFSGDAERSTKTYAGQQARLNTQIFNAKAAIGDTLLPVIVELMETISPLLMQLTQWIKDNPELTKKIIIAGTAIIALTAIVSGLIVVLNPISLLLLVIGTAIATMAMTWRGAMGTVRDITVAVVRTIHTKFTTLRNAIIKIVENIRETVIREFTNIKNKVINVVEDIKSKITGVFNNIGSTMREIGNNIVEGLWDGINNKVGWIGQKISGFVSDVKDKFKKMFDINSPSRVMAAIGEDVTAGLALGMENKINLVNDASAATAGAVVNQTVNANVSSGIDIDTLAEQMAFKLRNEL